MSTAATTSAVPRGTPKRPHLAKTGALWLASLQAEVR